jgi:sugar phosphate isomerase/epimerase
MKNIKRRHFTKMAIGGSAIMITSRTIRGHSGNPLRLGGRIFTRYQNPDEWIKALRNLNYSSAYCPVKVGTPDDVIRAYKTAAEKANIVIAEVGAWSNPISPNQQERQNALEKCRNSLALADQIGARCCVNISGSKNTGKWSGHHPENLTQDTFHLIVETTRSIIDAVKPTRTFFTLETMPWAFPDSVDSYIELFKAIDRKQFAVHFDPVNIVSSPQRYYSNTNLIKYFIKELGPYIKSCHAKDILLQQDLTTHLDEVRAGLGNLDYRTYLSEIAKLPTPPPIMIEHLKTAKEYQMAADHIRFVARKNGLKII